MKALQAERALNGPYKDIDDFASRVPESVMNKRQIESLSSCGAFDSIHKDRRQLFEDAQMLTQYNRAINEEKTSSQESLFGGDAFAGNQKIKLKEYPAWTNQEKILKEFEAIGFYLDNHPVEGYLNMLPKDRFIPICDLEDRIPMTVVNTSTNKYGGRTTNYANTMKTYLIGVPNRVVHRATGGRRFSYFFLSDPTGMIEINIFEEDLINNSRDLLEGNQPLVILVEARKDEGGIRLIAEEIVTIDSYLKTLKSRADIYVNESKFGQATLDQIKALFVNDNLEEAKIKIPVSINIRAKNNIAVRLQLPENYVITNEELLTRKFNDFELRVSFG
jgi:DNA polymerase-3 subunit alpha